MNRRRFLSRAIAMVATPVAAQKAILEKGQAKICDDNGSFTCPNGHKTCASINAPPAVGSDAYQIEDVAALKSFHMMRCEVCHVLFTRE
ncbi:MAG TPA: hypothetical protein VMU05_11595 [Dongiaceae bacterium]|nr:hypothetical protein [Dongiaceae bacterium]